jgi:hypothetical protein
MAGVRIRHVSARGVTYTLVDGTRKYLNAKTGNPAPIDCFRCGTVHAFKTYHITLDSTGFAVVSPEIAAIFSRLGDSTGFTVMGEVVNPPTQFVSMTGNGIIPSDLPKIITSPDLREPGRG